MPSWLAEPPTDIENIGYEEEHPIRKENDDFTLGNVDFEVSMESQVDMPKKAAGYMSIKLREGKIANIMYR